MGQTVTTALVYQVYAVQNYLSSISSPLPTKSSAEATASLTASENISYSCMKLNFMKNRKLLMIFTF